MKYKTILGKIVELTDERIKHVKETHPDVIEHLPKIKNTLLIPDQVRIDNLDPKVLLFYKYFSKIGNGKYLVAVVKLNKRNFILTFYSTYRIRTGKKYEF